MVEAQPQFHVILTPIAAFGQSRLPSLQTQAHPSIDEYGLQWINSLGIGVLCRCSFGQASSGVSIATRTSMPSCSYPECLLLIYFADSAIPKKTLSLAPITFETFCIIMELDSKTDTVEDDHTNFRALFAKEFEEMWNEVNSLIKIKDEIQPILQVHSEKDLQGLIQRVVTDVKESKSGGGRVQKVGVILSRIVQSYVGIGDIVRSLNMTAAHAGPLAYGIFFILLKVGVVVQYRSATANGPCADLSEQARSRRIY
jgi:hypothetical protein